MPERRLPACCPSARRLYYTAALENAASAMEIAAIAGRMTALLAAQHLKQRGAAAAGAARQQPEQGHSAAALVQGGDGAEGLAAAA